MKGFLVTPFLAIAVHSCGPPATSGGFNSANPASKIYAIENAVRQDDRPAVKNIIEQLDSDDQAVRAVAIAALKRMTGETFGYRDFDPPDERRAAIDRWKQAWTSGEIQRLQPPPAQRPSTDG